LNGKVACDLLLMVSLLLQHLQTLAFLLLLPPLMLLLLQLLGTGYVIAAFGVFGVSQLM
jgi:hypothetical protein